MVTIINENKLRGIIRESLYNVLTESTLNRIENYVENQECAIITSWRDKLQNITKNTFTPKHISHEKGKRGNKIIGDVMNNGDSFSTEEKKFYNRELKSYYAPDVVRGTDGRYYLYYSVANSSVTSVAVCNTPAGKYKYLGDVHFPGGRVYGSRAEDWFVFDPAVLVDTDGRIYLYVGSGQPSNGRFGHKIVGLFVMELDRDMLTIRSEPTILLPADNSSFSHKYHAFGNDRV